MTAVYVCLGNHDAGKTASQMLTFLEQANIHLLSDTYTVIDNRLIVAGRLDRTPIGGYADMEQHTLPESFTEVDPTLPVIMLDHNRLLGHAHARGHRQRDGYHLSEIACPNR